MPQRRFLLLSTRSAYGTALAESFLAHSKTLRVRLRAGFMRQLLDGASPLALSANRNSLV